MTTISRPELGTFNHIEITISPLVDDHGKKLPTPSGVIDHEKLIVEETTENLLHIISPRTRRLAPVEMPDGLNGWSSQFLSSLYFETIGDIERAWRLRHTKMIELGSLLTQNSGFIVKSETLDKVDST